MLARIAVGGVAWKLAVGPDSVWVQVGDLGAARIDPVTNRVTARVPGIASVAFVGGELWAAAVEQLRRLNATTGETVDTIALPVRAFRVVPGLGSLWAPTESGVLRVDPVSKAIVATVPITGCGAARDAEVGFGAFWLACRDSGVVVRVDAATNSAGTPIPTADGAHTIAIGFGSVWVSNDRSNSVSRIDPSTNRVLATVGGLPDALGIMATTTGVWVGTSAGLARIDPATNTVGARLALPATRWHYWIAEGHGALWVSASLRQTVYRIDPSAAG